MPNTRQHLALLCFLALLILPAGCSPPTGTNPEKQGQPQAQENIDSGCAYYNFLLGSRAEYAQHFDEALNAYQKAAACDPTANYIVEKIPILLIKMGKLQEAEKWLQTFVAEHPDENSQRLLLAEINIHNGNLPEATRLYQEARRHDPDNEAVLLRLAILLSQAKEYKEAEDILGVILKKNSQSYFANLYLARIYTQTGAADQALSLYEAALALNWSKELATEIADFQGQHGNFDKALALYRSIQAIDKEDEQASLGVIQTLLSMDREKQAFAELARLRSFSKHPEKIDIIESQIHLRRGKPAAAEKLLAAVIKKKGALADQAEYLLAIAYLEEKKPDMALRVLKNIGAKSDEFENGLILQIRILRNTNHIDQAIALLEKIIADHATRKPLYYALLSSLFQEKPDIQKGISVLTEGIGMYPDNEQLLFELAILLEKAGMREQALTNMEKILQLQPDHAEALNYIGYTWAEENRNLDKALDYIQRAIAQKPLNGFIRDSLGWVYFRLGDFNRAVEELEKAVGLEPRDPHIYDHLGDAYQALGRNAKALEVYAKALELSTEEPDKASIQKKIEILKNLKKE